MAKQFRTHLMFDGTAEEAMNFYVILFPESGVRNAIHYDEGEIKGNLQYASFSLSGREFICIDTPVKHDFGSFLNGLSNICVYDLFLVHLKMQSRVKYGLLFQYMC